MSVKIKSNTLKVYRNGEHEMITALRGDDGKDWNPTEEELDSIADRAANKLGNTISDIQDKVDKTLYNVRINGRVVQKDEDNVVDIPIATYDNTYGLVKTSADDGIVSLTDGTLSINPATTSDINNRTDDKKPVVSAMVDYATKSALVNSKISWSGSDKEKARDRLGFVVISAEEYALIPHDESTIYMIVG